MARLIPHSHADRMARRAEKRRKLLGFLRVEIWTTPAVAAQVMGISDPRTIKSTLASMQVDDLLVLDQVVNPAGRKISVVGITLKGQAHAADTLQKPFVARAYETGRLGLTQVDHRIDLQQLRVQLAQAGWKGWSYPDRVPVADQAAQAHRADALVTHPAGATVAIECERTIKSVKRYRFILGAHLAAISTGDYLKVIYAAPDEAMAKALRSIFNSLPRVVSDGRDVPLLPEALASVHVCTYDQLPTLELTA